MINFNPNSQGRVEINMDNVMILIDSAIVRKGRDYKYYEHFDFCEYFAYDPEKNSAPVVACIIGHALDIAGFPKEKRRDLGCVSDVFNLFGYQASSPIGPDAGYTAFLRCAREYEESGPCLSRVDKVFTITPGALMVFKAAQVKQDAMLTHKDGSEVVDENNRYISRYTWGEARDWAARVHLFLLEKGVR